MHVRQIQDILQSQGGSDGFSVVNSACPMSKDFNTVVRIRRAMFHHLNNTIIVQVFKGVCNVPRLLWQRYSAAKRKLSFSKRTSITYCFFKFFTPMKFSSQTRDMRRNYLVELDLFIKKAVGSRKTNSTMRNNECFFHTKNQGRSPN